MPVPHRTRATAGVETRADAVDPVLVGRARDLLDRAEILIDNADGVPDTAERFRQVEIITDNPGN